MESLGETLREARHNKRASLEDAARATRIKLEILEKLEADEFDSLVAPTYTKGFLKLYAEYLGLDSQTVVESYLRSQGGLRREGLKVETEATIRARKPRELQLPLRSVALAVAAVTIAILAIVVGKTIFTSRPAETAQVVQPVVEPTKPAPALEAKLPPLPKADFDAYYQPKTKPAPELLDLPQSK